jgi:hypothetical protein
MEEVRGCEDVRRICGSEGEGVRHRVKGLVVLRRSSGSDRNPAERRGRCQANACRRMGSDRRDDDGRLGERVGEWHDIRDSVRDRDA